MSLKYKYYWHPLVTGIVRKLLQRGRCNITFFANVVMVYSLGLLRTDSTHIELACGRYFLYLVPRYRYRLKVKACP